MKWALLAVASIAFGALVQWLHVPAAWLIAPMIVAIVAAVQGIGIRLPRWSLAVPQGVIGVTIAQAFTTPVIGEVLHEWVPILIVVIATVVAAGTAGWLLARYSPISASTAAWGSSPGASVTMIALSADYGADPRIVAFMQYLRITFVVLTASLVSHLVLSHANAAPPPAAPGTTAFELVPFFETLAFAIVAPFAGKYSRLPGGQFIFPLVIGAWLHVTGICTSRNVVAARCGVSRRRLDDRFELYARNPDLHPRRAADAAALHVRSARDVRALGRGTRRAAARRSAHRLSRDDAGGLDSVSIIALGSGSNVALVLAIQMLRCLPSSPADRRLRSSSASTRRARVRPARRRTR